MIKPTFRNQFEETIQRLRAYQSAVDEAAIVSITDTKGIILYANAKFSEISQYSKEELIGKTHQIVNSGYHSRNFFAEMWETITQGQPWRGEIRNKAKDGSFYWVDTVITPICDREGRIFQYLSIRNLITDKKENEEKLLNAQRAILIRKKQLKEAQKVAKTGSWHINMDNNLLTWSEETYRIFEIPHGTGMSYETFLETVHPADRSKVEQAWNAALTSGSYSIEHRITTASGLKWVSERARLEFDERGALVDILGTVQDITEKKKNEEHLKESEELYKNLFNNSPFAIGIMDKQTLQFLKVNQTAVDLYGYSEEEFMKLTAFDIRVPEGHEDLKHQIMSGSYASTRKVLSHRKKDGSIIQIEPSIIEISFKGEKAFLITITDITEKIRIQEELMQTRTNRQKDILRATLEAQEKSRADIGRELHDNINQLLVASVLYLKSALLSGEPKPDLVQAGSDVILNAIEEIRKLSSSFVPPSLKDISLKESIEILLENFKLTGAAVKCSVRIHEHTIPDGMKLTIYRIIQEQCNNIIKYASATTVLVAIEQRENLLTIAIEDDGKGFDPNKKGKGIGLTNIVHRAEAYNGEVSIESSPGNGCKITVRFELVGPE